jgi:branched-chain amino acid aminotransferase
MTASDFFCINGRVMPAAEATISVLDLGYLRGVGAFETLRTYGGHPHAVSEHLARLWASAALCGIAPCFTEHDARRVIAEILQRSGHAELRVNIVVSPGEHTTGVFGSSTPTWVMIARDVHAPPEAWYREGVSAVTFRADRPLAAHKTTSYLSGRQGIAAAEAVGAHEAFYLDAHDFVTEGVTSNVLILSGTVVTTPVDGCLSGITKAGLRPLAEQAGLSWREAPVSRAHLLAADEVWITSAVREVLPIVRVDGQAIAKGTVGPWAARLRPLYREACVAHAAADAQRHVSSAAAR